VSIENKESLENVFFFNQNQMQYFEEIEYLISTFGRPFISEINERIYLKFEKIECQNIFASINNQFVGLGVYCRDSIKNIDLIHIAVEPEYSSRGKLYDKLIAIQIIGELKAISKRLKGVETVTVKYLPSCIIDI